MANAVLSHEERRLQLDAELRGLLKNKNTYFQPPATVNLKYPCFVYELSGVDTKYANNSGYLMDRCYEVSHIHTDPDVDYIDKMQRQFKYCRFDRRYIADNLYHDIYTIYY